jgi:aryl-alcohol dehydrogenase-like predicted oxidoreductase
MPDTTPAPDLNHARPGGAGTLGDRTVSRVGYGAMQLERLGDRAAAVALLRRAVELDVDHVDTAQFYGNGLSNEVIREALRPEDGVTVVSKVGADPNPGGEIPLRVAQRPDELRASVEANLRSLGLEQIPVVNLRRMEGPVRIPVAPDQLVDLDDQLAAMVAMRDEGLIGAIGLSSVGIDTLRRSLGAGIVCVQNPYSLVSRGGEELLELCAAEGIAWVPFFPLGGAFAGLPKVTDEPVVAEIAGSLGASPAQVGLAWLLHHSPNVHLIPGTTSVEHLEANVAAGHITLDDDALAALDAVPQRAQRAPGAPA